ncbi:MAG: hypothetical protein ACOYXN_03105, partial [Acidobacteriota bacterium]
LKLPPRYSGDNWRVAVYKIDPKTGQEVPNQLPSRSPIYTGWKRVFIEKDRMVRRGGVLRNDATASQSSLFLYKSPDDTRWDNLHEGDKVALFDASNPFEGPHDEAYVAPGGIDTNYPPAASGEPHRVKVDLVTSRGGSTPYLLLRSYSASPPDASLQPNFSLGAGAALGVVNSADGLIYDTSTNQINAPGSAFYDADLRDVEEPFRDGYVEVVARREGSGAVPYISERLSGFYVDQPGGGASEPGRSQRRNFQELWFAHKGTSNYVHALGVRGPDAQGGQGVGGFSWAWSLYLFMHAETLQQLEPDGSLRRLLEQSSLDHEMGHEFKVNACSGFHDTRQAWCGVQGGACANEPCLMQADGGAPRNATNRFCKEDLLGGDPKCGNGDGSIRRSPDLVKTE